MRRSVLYILLAALLFSVPISQAQTPREPQTASNAVFRVTEVLPASGSAEVATNAVITVIFNRPAVPLTLLSERDNLPNPLTLTPAVDGEGEWINTAIYAFRPSIALAGGTQYVVRVDGLTSVDGIPVEPFTTDFVTELPRVVSVEPQPLSNGFLLDDPLSITFNQPMNSQSVESAFQLATEVGSLVIPTTFSWNNDSTEVTIQPSEQLALDTLYRAALNGAIVRPLVGNAPLAGEAPNWSFLTVPPPSIVSTSPLDGAQAIGMFGGFTLNFASPMNQATIRDKITIEPEPPYLYGNGFYSSYDNSFRLNYEAAPSTTYTITIAPGMQDIYGNVIERSTTVTYTTRDLEPEVALQTPGEFGFYNALSDKTELYLAYRNVETVDLSLYAPPVQSLLSVITTPDTYSIVGGYQPQPSELLRNWTVTGSDLERNIRRYDLLNLSGGGTNATGITSCPGALPSRIAVGDVGIVTTEPDPLRARMSPPNGEIVDLLYRDYQFEVVNGPQCIDNIAWYEITLRDDTTAWIAESVGDEYFVDVRIAAERSTITIPTNTGGALAPGMYFLRVTSPQTSNDPYGGNAHFLMVSTVNLTMKHGVDEVFVWATNVQTGEPIANLPVQFYGSFGQLFGTQVTDADGIARLNIPRRDNLDTPLVAMVETADQFGLSLSRFTNGIEYYSLGVPFTSRPQQYTSYTYTDRPIYRPDQPVYFRGVVREKSDVTYTPPNFNQVRVRIDDNQGNTVYEQQLAVDAYGAYSDVFTLAEDAALGNYNISVETLDADPIRLGGLGFSVAEFRLPEYQVNVTAEMPQVLKGNDLPTIVEGSYFFGGAVSNANVDYRVEAIPYSFNYNGRGRYSFIDRDPYDFYRYDYPFGRQIITGDAITDDQGQALLTLPTNAEDLTGTQRYTVEATITDETGLSVSGRTDAIVHAAEFYVGVGLDRYVNRVNETATANLIAVDWDSVPIANQPINILVEQWVWSTVQEVDSLGQTVFRSEVEQIVIATDTITTATDGTAQYDFVPSNAGVYKIKATARDAEGNEIVAGQTMWVSGSQFVNWRQGNDKTIDLIADADEYQVGDTAQILIASPYQGATEALITVERGGVLQVEQITMTSNSMVYELPITEDYAPNVFVGVMLVKGVDVNNPIANFRYGATQLRVNNERKQVQIAITPDTEQASPRETVTYTVKTTDYAGNPVSAQVGVGLTDLASLSIAPPNSGEILERYFGAQPLSVVTGTPLTINTDEITEYVEEVLKGGGGGGGGGGGIFEIRSEFVDTAYWNAQLVTNANGEAQFSVDLPDNLTTWRLDARAITLGIDDPFLVGQDTFDLLATKPLLIRPVTPRFLVVNDEAVLSAVVNNNTGAEQVVTSFIEFNGLRLIDDATLEQTQTIPAGGRGRFTWQVTAADVEAVDITFFASADGGTFTDASKSPVGQGDDRLLPVYRFNAQETVGTAGILESGESITEGISRSPLLQGGSLRINLEPSLAVTTLDGLDYLRNYPHQCTEQTVSRFLPNIITYQALQQLNLADPELAANLDEQVNLGLQMLYNRQNVDGGWGWFSQDRSNDLVTAYVVLGLHEAQQAGYPVPQNIVSSGQAYLRSSSPMIRGNALSVEDWVLNREAFILYVLAETGSPQPANMSNLFEERARLTTESKAFLALALHLGGGVPDDSRINTLMSDIMSTASVSATGTYWSSDGRLNWTTRTRATAIVLKAMIAINPDSDLIPNVVRYLVSARTADAWETTQETAWAVMSLSDWMVASGELQPNYSFAAVLNGETLVSDAVDASRVRERITLAVDVAELVDDTLNDLVIRRDAGNGVLYYTAFLDASLPVDALEPVNSGISVARRYTRTNAAGEQETIAPDALQAVVGEIIQVRLTIVVPEDRHYLVIEDPIPAGAEPIDPQLDTNQQIGTRPQLNPQDPYRQGWGWWWFSNIEFRDEQVALYSTYLPAGTYEYVYSIRASIPGTYNVIPPTAHEFYFPDVYGRGNGTIFTIREE